MSNLWITSSGKDYWATTDEQSWYCGGFKRSVRAVRKLLLEDKSITNLVLPSLRELKHWSRVENPDHEELQQPLLKLVAKRGIHLMVPPGLSEKHPWPEKKVVLTKLRAKSSTDNRIVIYTDGSCLGNPGFGGWAFASKSVSRSGSEADATNNMMEMQACLEALHYFRKHKPGAPLLVISDSRYVVNGCTTWRHGWAMRGFKDIANADRWRVLARECTLADVEWRWVKGHSGVAGNEKVDKLAGLAARALRDKS